MTRAEFWQAFDKIHGDQSAQYALHREYWGQYVTDAMRRAVAKHFGDALARSVDPHLNDTTSVGQWDRLQYLTAHTSAKLRANGDSWSLSANICILKEAARQELGADDDSPRWPHRETFTIEDRAETLCTPCKNASPKRVTFIPAGEFECAECAGGAR